MLQVINGLECNGESAEKFYRGENLAWMWQNLLLQEGLGQVPEAIRYSRSSEFFVRKDRIQAHPRSFYLRCLQFILQNPLQLPTWPTGILFEHIWHIIFGEKAFLDGLTVPGCVLYDCKQQSSAKDRRLLVLQPASVLL